MTVLDLSRVRQRLASFEGKAYWKSLEELAETPEFQEFLHREFATPIDAGVDRRRFLTLMGASLALAGLTGCTRQPTEKIVPYVRAPEEFVPGKPLFYATAVTLGGFARGVLVESHMGRPTKVEGNPLHPASLGATDIYGQAEVLTLYDPDRSQTLAYLGEIRPWSAFLGTIRSALSKARANPGTGLRILTETITSPTLARQIEEVLRAYPAARWHQFEPVNRDNVRAGTRLAFGEPLEPQYRYDRADVVVSLDADFLGSGPAQLRHVRDFISRRRAAKDKEMNRLYVAESSPTLTGARADHRLPTRATAIAELARALAAGNLEKIEAPASTGPFLAAVAADLNSHRGRSLVVAGETQPPEVHALAHLANERLGNAGATVVYTDPAEANPVDQMTSLRELASDMEAGRVETLLILGGNPVFTAPADFRFAERLARVPLRIHLSLYEDETSALCQWHVPAAHVFESWSDARSSDGTLTILQPLIAPLYGGKSAHELLAALSDEPERSGHDIVKGYWRERGGAGDFEAFWRRSLHDGVVSGSPLPEKSVRVTWSPSGTSSLSSPPASPVPPPDIEILFRPDPTIFDGRYANNGWLQELPKPLTKLTWDNAILVSPAMAERLDLASEDVVELSTAEGRAARGPVWIQPGHADGCVTVHFGYGRSRAGRIGTGAGFNAFALRSSESPWSTVAGQLAKSGARATLACTQQHHSMEGRNLVVSATIGEYREDPGFVREKVEEPGRAMTMYPGHKSEGYAWGMAIDLSTCIGCNACVIACQAENNIPIVGKREVARGREMHWIRVDRYYGGGDLDNPRTLHQPVPCMQCENAPCELVCPVAATVHSAEGLNDMVYNRCVGTRYCSNNCPYKVRRFNFFKYADFETPSLKLLRNPDVTVRSRGVMEKCTYCVQRINAARIETEKEGRKIRDGEIVTACQQACPAQAIVFGDINDPESRVSKWKGEMRNYSLLAELNTRPRTTYLASLSNPSPDLDSGREAGRGTREAKPS